MSQLELLIVVVIVLTVVHMLIALLKNRRNNAVQPSSEFNKAIAELNKIDPLIRQEFFNNRSELQGQATENRQALTQAINEFSGRLQDNIKYLSDNQTAQLENFSNLLRQLTTDNETRLERQASTNERHQQAFREQISNTANESKEALTIALKSNSDKTDQLINRFGENSTKLTELFNNSALENRRELSTALRSFEEKFTQNVQAFNELQHQKFSDLMIKLDQQKSETELKLESIRGTVENKLQTLQEDNSRKLEEMRNTVDEKLQSTLEKRFTDSFTMISQRLEEVHKGLGEMQTLANSVGDIKKVMTNVKSRGILGEYQLANLLEDLLTNEQYEKNVKTKPNSGAVVEFAVKMPNNNSIEKTLWLPIDSKFPKEDYESLVDAYDEGDPVRIDQFKKSFRNAIIKNAKDIKEKYIAPPNTTEYGIMFLPFESLFAEVLRSPGLFDTLQKEYKITVTGPTTLSALLSSLQMGFRTLAIEKRSSEVWDVLGAVKTEFGKFGTILEKTRKKLQEATNTIDQAGVRSRAIERKLRNVQDLPHAGEVGMDSRQDSVGGWLEASEDWQMEGEEATAE